ncbi:MAG: hypothetical protein Q9216_000809 [Gyalolechia sp. 2 TL-2023]
MRQPNLKGTALHWNKPAYNISLLGFWRRGNASEMDILSEQLRESSSHGRPQVSSARVQIRGRSAEPFEGLREKRNSDSTGLEELKLMLQKKEMEMSAFKEQQDELVQTYHGVMSENQQLKNWISRVTGESESTQVRNRCLERELQACKDDLFQIHPRNQVSDCDIGRMYDDLDEHISSWVEGEVSRLESKFRKTHHAPLPDLFCHGGMPAAETFLAAHQTSGGEYFIRCLIHILLQKSVFVNGILLFGLDEAGTALLQQIERGMSKAKPPRDLDSINAWRSETLSALLTTTNFQRSRSRSIACVVNHMGAVIAKYFPPMEKSNRRLQSIYDKVINPAIQLADAIQTSSTRYCFVPTMEALQSPFEDSVISQCHLIDLKLIDIATGKTLKANSPVQANERGDIGTRIMILAPALYRYDTGQDALLLVKETVLVQLYQPLGKRQSGSGQ